MTSCRELGGRTPSSFPAEFSRTAEAALSYQDQFGYIPEPFVFSLPGLVVESLPNYQEVLRAVGTWTHPDGHIYPPIQHTRQLIGKKRSKKVPQSERGALLQGLPATHSLALTSDTTQNAARHGTAGFVIHFLGLLYGYRCQFHDWWIDGRYSPTASVDYSLRPRTKVEEVLGTAIDAWRAMTERQRIVTVNAMFLHERAIGLQMEWERLQAEYQVFDAAFALARDTGRLSKRSVPHARRIQELCASFGIPAKDDLIAIIVKLRNDLIHEALWDGRMPGEARSLESVYASMWLSALTRRLLFSVLGLKGSYVRSAWWGMGSMMLDLVP